MRTLAECTQVLCARRGEILKILHVFRAIFNGFSRKICTLSNAGRALFRIQTHYRFIQELQRRHAVCAAHAGRQLAFLCARHAEILKILHFFHANFAAKCASSRFLTCAFFGCQCTADSVNSCSDAMGTLADGPQLLCTRCAEIPKILQFFRAILAPILRDLDAERALFRV